MLASLEHGGTFCPEKPILIILMQAEAFIRMEKESRTKRAGEGDMKGSYSWEKGTWEREGTERV